MLSKFLLTKLFWKQLAYIIGISIILVLGVIFYLNIYTQHGEEFEMPDLVGQNIYDIELGNKYPHLNITIVDSIYESPENAGNIIKQKPAAHSHIKRGRKVYVTIISSQRELTIMPNLKDLTLRLAINMLNVKKLKLGEVSYKPSFAKNAVLQQYYNNDTIHEGDTLVVGSVIDLDVGKGKGRMELNLPFLYGKTRIEAIDILTKASFNLGKEVYLDEEATKDVLVYDQSPSPLDGIDSYAGDTIHLWYRSSKYSNFKSHLDSLKQLDSLQSIIKEQFDTNPSDTDF
jgi:beta-lactam-binding protein with PASTA domain